MYRLPKLTIGELVKYQLTQLNILLLITLICFASCKPTFKAYNSKGEKIKLIRISSTQKHK